MQKTFAMLLVTLVVSVMGIPVAYLVGQRSAQQALHEQYESELNRTRAEQQEMIASLRSEFTANALEQQRSEAATREALATAGIRVAEAAVPPPAEEPAALELEAIPVETFDSVDLGTPYDEIVQRFGRDGVFTLMLEDGAGSVTEQYVWDWPRQDGQPGRIHMEFVDGLLNDKSFRE